MNLLSLHPSSFNEKPFHAFCGLLLVSVVYYTYVHLDCISIISSRQITVTMGLHMNDGHIIYYYLDATQSVGLMQTCFNHLDFLVVQCWICAMFMLADMVTQTGLHVNHYFKFFLEMGYMPLDTPCDCIMVILDCPDAVQPFILTTFPALRLSLLIIANMP